MDWELFSVALGGGLACGVIVIWQWREHRGERDKLAIEHARERVALNHKIDELESKVDELRAQVDAQSALIVRYMGGAHDTKPSINLTAHGDANIGGDVVGRDKS